MTVMKQKLTDSSVFSKIDPLCGRRHQNGSLPSISIILWAVMASSRGQRSTARGLQELVRSRKTSITRWISLVPSIGSGKSIKRWYSKARGIWWVEIRQLTWSWAPSLRVAWKDFPKLTTEGSCARWRLMHLEITPMSNYKSSIVRSTTSSSCSCEWFWSGGRQ